MAAKNKWCAVKEPATHIDACACKVTQLYKCNLPDSTCRHRAVIAGSSAGTVAKAAAYDFRVAADADKNKNKLLAECKGQRRTCPHKATPVPHPPDPEMDNSGQPTGDGPRASCEIAQQVRYPVAELEEGALPVRTITCSSKDLGGTRTKMPEIYQINCKTGDNVVSQISETVPLWGSNLDLNGFSS